MSNSKKSLNKINGIKEIELINNLFFYWMYYFIYSYKLIINFKKEFDISENNFSNQELKLQIYYSFIGLITVNIIIYALEEYQYFNLNIHSIINEIQLIFVYFSIYLFFIIYSILLNLYIKNTTMKLFQSTILVTLKIFNLLYPLLLLFCAFLFDIIITRTIEYDLNENLKTVILANNYLVISFSLIILIFIFLIGYSSFNLIKKYIGIKNNLSIFIIVSIIYGISITISNIFVYPYTLNTLIKNIHNSDNFCVNVLKIKFKMKENYTFDNYEIDLKQCYKNFF